jgi:L-ribulokinase
VLNQVYANILGRPVLVPSSRVTSLGAAIFAFLAAGTFGTIEEAQERICPTHTVYSPDPGSQEVYDQLFGLYRDIYFEFGKVNGTLFGRTLPKLIEIASEVTAQAQVLALK